MDSLPQRLPVIVIAVTVARVVWTTLHLAAGSMVFVATTVVVAARVVVAVVVLATMIMEDAALIPTTVIVAVLVVVGFAVVCIGQHIIDSKASRDATTSWAAAGILGDKARGDGKPSHRGEEERLKSVHEVCLGVGLRGDEFAHSPLRARA